MSDETFRRLREGSAPSSPYTFGGPSSRPSPSFRSQPAATPPSQTVVRSTYQQQQTRAPERTQDGDRPPAYEVAPHEKGPVEEWRSPTLGDIFKDLGLRIIEVGIVALASAAADELAYFFRRRRFYPRHPPRYPE